jgi:glycosyltransferase involved in cell wall biosynthesis
MRVAHVAQSTAGGIASYFEEIAESQANAFGRENVIFIVPSEGAHVPKVAASQLSLFGSASRRPRDLFHFARVVRSELTRFRPDIVHLHSSFAGAIVRPMIVNMRPRPKIIYCPHGWAFAMETSTSKQRAYAWIERRLAAATDLIHVNSRSEFEVALSFGLPGEKMQIFANGIAPRSLPEKQDRSGPIRLAFVGRHDRQKGLDILLDTIRRTPVPGLEFEIVGEGVLSEGVPPAGGDYPNVRFHGWLSRQQTLELVESADAVVLPSRWDAAPIVATEALRAGVPVIGSNRGAIPEIVQHGVGGYIFDLDDPRSLARILQSLDRTKLSQLGRSARQRWEALYQSDRMNDLTCRAYRELLPGVGAAPVRQSSASRDSSQTPR